jgi:hypothetical protein
MKSLTRVVLAVSAVSFASAAFAVAPFVVETFKTVRYTTPEAWAAKKSDSALILTPKEQEEGKLMAILVVPGGASSGSIEEALDKVWESFLKNTEMEGEIKSRKEYKTKKGVKYLSGVGALNKDGQKMVAVMNVYEANGRFEYVMVVGSDAETIKKNGQAVTGFLSTLDFVSEGAEEEPTPAKGDGGLIDL